MFSTFLEKELSFGILGFSCKQIAQLMCVKSVLEELVYTKYDVSICETIGLSGAKCSSHENQIMFL